MSPWMEQVGLQFGNPQGFWGRIVGKVMAWSSTNQKRSQWTVDLLDVQPEHRVLEIGFGPGLAIALLSERAHQGRVVGIDHSQLMLEQASQKNRAAIAAGRVELRCASAEAIPHWEQPFDRIVAINTSFFWKDPEARWKELYALLAPGGWMAVTIQPRAPGSTDDTTRQKAEELRTQLEAAGFSDIRLEYIQLKPVLTVCALAHKPPISRSHTQ